MRGRRSIKKEQRREEERQIWAFRQRGWTQARIADELKLHVSTICRVLAKLSDRYLKEVLEDVGRVKVQQTLMLEHIVSESLDAWERSKEPARRATLKKGAGEGNQNAETQSVEEQIGDTVFLDSARAALADMRKIWGADAPVKTSSEVDLRARVTPMSELSDDELDAIIRGAEQSAPVRGSPGSQEAPECPPESSRLHDVHEAGLPDELAPSPDLPPPG